MYGSGGFSFTATGTLTYTGGATPADMAGAAQMVFAADGYLTNASIPENGPSGGANWTRGYKPTHDYINQRRRSRRDEILFLRG